MPHRLDDHLDLVTVDLGRRNAVVLALSHRGRRLFLAVVSDEADSVANSP